MSNQKNKWCDIKFNLKCNKFKCKCMSKEKIFNSNKNKLLNRYETESDYRKNMLKKLNERKVCEYFENSNNIRNLNIVINKNVKYYCKETNKGVQLSIKNECDFDSSTKNIEKVLQYLNNKKLPYQELFEVEPVCRLLDRLVVGLGEPSVRKINIKLDHIYGVPFIPASSLKGAFRAFIDKGDYSFYLSEKINKKIIENILKYGFGSNDNQGYIIFKDTYPEKFKIENDVMTKHYGDYYKEDGKKSPRDDMETEPIVFYILKDSEFKFRVFLDTDNLNYEEESNDGLKKLFILFLEHCSLGAKKSVGYGYLRVERGE